MEQIYHLYNLLKWCCIQKEDKVKKLYEAWRREDSHPEERICNCFVAASFSGAKYFSHYYVLYKRNSGGQCKQKHYKFVQLTQSRTHEATVCLLLVTLHCSTCIYSLKCQEQTFFKIIQFPFPLDPLWEEELIFPIWIFDGGPARDWIKMKAICEFANFLFTPQTRDRQSLPADINCDRGNWRHNQPLSIDANRYPT